MSQVPATKPGIWMAVLAVMVEASKLVERLTFVCCGVVVGLTIPPGDWGHVHAGVTRITGAGAGRACCRHPLARSRRAEGVARLAVQRPVADGPARPRAHPRDRDLARLLRGPRGAVGGA